MSFFYVYKALAHPEYRNYVAPFTLEERLLHVKEAQRTLGSRIPWLADPMDNPLKNALGGVPNAEIVVGPDGLVVGRRAWSDPEALRRDLARLVGEVRPRTRVDELDMKPQPPTPTLAKGVVPRIEVPGPMRALIVEPVLEGAEHPFYVKLRAEADAALLDQGRGKLYVGFHLDPLYRMHWNNRAKPLEFELAMPEAIRVTPAAGRAPRIERALDADPREFLLDVEHDDAEGSLELTVRYFACDDANTFCVPVRQSYAVRLEPDPHGGSVFSRTRFGGDQQARPFHSPAMRWDVDGDGRLTRDEAPLHMRRRFQRFDANGDGTLDPQEIKAMNEAMHRRSQGGRRNAGRDPE